LPTKIISTLAYLTQTADSMPAGSLVQFDKAFLVRIGIQWFNIILLTAVLIFVLYKPVKKFMTNRIERIKNEIDSARQTNEKAKDLKAEYEKLIADIGEEREKILSQARRVAVERSDQILFAAQEEAKHLLQKAEDEIKLEREKVADDIKMQIIELSSLMASRFVEVSIDKQTQDKYIDEALEKWGEETWQV